MSVERYIPVGGNKLHVLIEGNADRPWITLLHGAATNLHLWDAQIAPLAKLFHILRIDVRGHGKSTADIVANSFEDLVADVIAVWDALGIRKSTVMGLSLGGMTGFGIAIHHPDRIRETRPDYVLLLPWNLTDEITKQMSYIRDWNGRFVVPIPEVKIL